MEGAVLVWLLCLQGSLLVDSLNCADKGTWKETEEYRRECAPGDATKALPAEPRGLKSLTPSGASQEPGHAQQTKIVKRNTDSKKKRKKYGPGAFSVLGITLDPKPTTEPDPPVYIRQKRHVERDRPRKQYYPGGTSVTGQPMRLMMTERSRRHLPASKPKGKRKPRVGSFSLLSHNQPKSLQVTRVRRQLQNDKKKKKPPKNPGQYSILGESVPPLQEHRFKRNVQPKKKKAKKIVCS